MAAFTSSSYGGAKCHLTIISRPGLRGRAPKPLRGFAAAAGGLKPTMSRESVLLFLADAILVTHVLFVLFVTFGLVSIYLGQLLRWRWIRDRIFRIAHLLAIGIVVVQSWIGVICPLTKWEMLLRETAGAEVYSGSFVQNWLHKLLYYGAPEWVFVVLYTVFGGLVLASWYLVRPNQSRA